MYVFVSIFPCVIITQNTNQVNEHKNLRSQTLPVKPKSGIIIKANNLSPMTNSNTDNAIISRVLKEIPIFSGLDESLHAEIIEHIVLMYYPKDYVIFQEDDEGDALHIVKNGRVEIYLEPKEAGDLPEKIAGIGPGGFFGEMALVSDLPRNASAKTTEEAEIFILSKEDFKKLLQSNTTLAQQVSATMVARMDENSRNEALKKLDQ